MQDPGTPKGLGATIRVILITVILTLIVAGAAAYFQGYLRLHRPKAPPAGAGPTIQKGAVQGTQTGGGKGKKILYWRAPMNPNEIYNKPGKSAMGMDLVPVYENEGGSASEIRIDPVIEQDMGIRTAAIRKGPLVHSILTYGHVTEDETRTTQINLKTSGWIERLYVDFTGKFVKEGDPLFQLYSPDLVAAQEELLVVNRSLGRTSGPRSEKLLDSARRRLRYFDIAEGEIHAIEKTGKVRKSLVIRSPFSGFVIQKNIEEGTFVKTGTTVFRIADLSHVWVDVHIYEYELPWVSEGQEAEMTLTYVPGKVFSGKVTYIYPYLQQKTRDVVIRLEFKNPELELKPDMYADVRIKSVAEKQGLIVPSEAVIRSGERNIVFVVRGKGKFTPRDVILGRTLDNDRVQVLVGVSEGEIIVTSGQFLLDSESKLREAVQKLMKPQEGKEGEDLSKGMEE